MVQTKYSTVDQIHLYRDQLTEGLLTDRCGAELLEELEGINSIIARIPEGADGASRLYEHMEFRDV